MQQTVAADADVTEEAADATIPVCGLSFYYFSVVDAETVPAFSAMDATMAVAAVTTIPVSGLSS